MAETLHNNLILPIAKAIHSTLESHFEGHGLDLAKVYHSLSEAPDLKMGHIAFACFPLAKTLKKGPPQIAAKLASELTLPAIAKSVTAAGPYLNFFINQKEMGNKIVNSIVDESFFKQNLIENGEKVMIEYSQPNTHKELHVGHMRNLCLGNALVRLGRYCGEDIVATTFPGDVGTHVAKCLWYYKFHNDQPEPTENKGAWIGTMYTKGNNKLEDELGTPKEDENRAQLTEILKQLHDEKGEFYDIWVKTRPWSIDLMKRAYAWAGVTFDRWFWESEVDATSLSYVKKIYDEGKLVKDQGAIGMDLSDDKLGFCLLVKSDGTGLYATKDLELARLKFEEFKVKKNIYIVDKRQAHHFKQVFKVLEKLEFKQAKDCYHLQYDVVELPDGAMSSRTGNIVPLMELISSMRQKIIDDYLEKYRGEWSDEEILQTADEVAQGAIKYGMIRVDNIRKIVFDKDEWLRLDGETGPYLQYVHARICSMKEKMKDISVWNSDWSALEHPLEIALMLKISWFNSYSFLAASQFKSMTMTGYLYELAKMFNSFYAECSIQKAETAEIKHARLALSVAVSNVMKTGLANLGIPSPKRM